MDPHRVARPGVEGGFWVAAGPIRGYAKPLGGDTVDPHRRPVAAIEKIASDLAFDLGLPVPPVTLFERKAPSSESRFHAVSAPPFAQVAHWWQVLGSPGVAAFARPQARGPMSAMLPFDTWVSCVDHHSNHPKNLLLTTSGRGPINVMFAFIDYAWSMTHTWREEGYRDQSIVPMYDPTQKPDADVVKQVVAAIEGLEDKTLNSIVDRVPDAFLSSSDKNLIATGLAYRRDVLRRTLARAIPGVAT